MIEQGFQAFKAHEDITDENSIVLAEISINDSNGKDLMVPEEDLIARVELLNALGYSVMVSDYTRYFSLRAYFRQYTSKQIGIVVGMINIKEIFDNKMYVGVEGGILEGFGKLFPDNTRLFVYPELDKDGNLNDFTSIKVESHNRYLYQHLLENKYVFGIECSDPELFKIYSRDVLAKLPKGRGEWEACLPDDTASRIIENEMFGYRG
jgi:hypothetical protein